jgi:hypothetical protein
MTVEKLQRGIIVQAMRVASIEKDIVPRLIRSPVDSRKEGLGQGATGILIEFIDTEKKHTDDSCLATLDCSYQGTGSEVNFLYGDGDSTARLFPHMSLFVKVVGNGCRGDTGLTSDIGDCGASLIAIESTPFLLSDIFIDGYKGGSRRKGNLLTFRGTLRAEPVDNGLGIDAKVTSDLADSHTTGMECLCFLTDVIPVTPATWCRDIPMLTGTAFIPLIPVTDTCLDLSGYGRTEGACG